MSPVRRGPGPLRVLLIAVLGALLIGFAGFAASSVLSPDKPIVQSMCLDSSCTYAMAAGDQTPSVPGRTALRVHKRESAPQRFVNEVLRICHLK